jgi:hypothetical protein
MACRCHGSLELLDLYVEALAGLMLFADFR